MIINKVLTLSVFSSFLFVSCYNTKQISNNETKQDSSVIIKKDYLNDKENIVYKNNTFNEKIKTVICHKEEEELSLPIINLNSDDHLLLSFDELDTDIKDYYYTILHCNSDWTASDLMESEYIRGFTDELITNYEYSFNTIQKYILTIRPNSNKKH